MTIEPTPVEPTAAAITGNNELSEGKLQGRKAKVLSCMACLCVTQIIAIAFVALFIVSLTLGAIHHKPLPYLPMAIGFGSAASCFCVAGVMRVQQFNEEDENTTSTPIESELDEIQIDIDYQDEALASE